MDALHYNPDDEFFYIIDEILSTSEDLSPGLRVFILPGDHVRLPNKGILQFSKGEGPYESIKQLKQNSELYREILETDPKRSIKIFDKKLILRPDNFIGYQEKGNKDFEKNIYNIILHTFKGEILSKRVSGVHYYNPDYVRITKLLEIDYNTGVQMAMIEVRKSKLSKWILKNKPTTLFPISWSLTRTITECEYAFLNKINISKTKYKGITKDGIEIIFIFNLEGKLKTVYPLCKGYKTNML